jgi:hypothetical protein
MVFPWIEDRPARQTFFVDTEEMVGFVVIARGTGQSQISDLIGSFERFGEDMLEVIPNPGCGLRRPAILTRRPARDSTASLGSGFLALRAINEPLELRAPLPLDQIL